MNDVTELTTEVEPLSQAEYDRAVKLDQAIKKATEELEALKARIKAEHTKKGTFIHGSVIVKIGEQNRVVPEETEKNFFDLADYEDFWETKKVLNMTLAKKEHPELIVTKTVPTVSITFADPN